MRGKVVLLGLLAMALVAPRARACSQCMCGTPFPADALGGVVPMQVRYGFEDRYLSKSNALDEAPGTEREREHRVSGFVLWRPKDKLALLARLPYNVKQIEERAEGEAAVTHREHGLGDAEVLALVGVLHTEGAHASTVGAVFGVTAPTGSNSQRDASGERLDSHLQPGTGAWSGMVGGNLSTRVGGGMAEASLLGRVNGRSDHGYRYGNTLLYNVGYMTAERRGWSLIAQLNGRSAERDRLEDGTTGENTGGTVVYVTPGVRWRNDTGFGVEAALQVPAFESLFGDQDEHTTGRIAISLGR